MLTIEQVKGAVCVACSGQPLVRYEAETAASKPHFSLLALPPTAERRAGENVVLAGPHDHVWHLGLFFAPRCIDGVNFWESEQLAHAGERYGSCRATGAARTQAHEDGSVSLAHDVRWHTSDDETVVSENREIRLHPPDGNAYRIDWTMVLTAVGRDRVWTSDGEHGDCGGFSFRSPRSMEGTGGDVINSEGASRVEGVHGRPARWADYTGKLDGSLDLRRPDRAGVTVFDHPANPGYPNAWTAMTRPFGFMAANLTFGTPWTFKKDEPVTLRFGVLVHYGAPDRQRIEGAYAAFVEGHRSGS